MFQPDAPPVWTVTDLTGYIRDLLESDYNLQDVWISGEISNLSQPRSGHLYFTLKDSNASVRCVMWRNSVARLRFLPRDGDAFEAHGKVSVYEASGQYQLYVDALRPLGEGILFQEFLRIKAKLEAEGLFDPERKRALPAWPKQIGLVTSPTGAALQDMLNTFRRRYPLVQVTLTPTLVQGEEAPAQIIQAIVTQNEVVQPDVIIIARGGGSIEDLWAFNDEFVARAIAGSRIPTITGVGHETDFTLADFAADLRAPTPTAAAELATPNREDLNQAVADRLHDLAESLLMLVSDKRWDLVELSNRLRSRSPEFRIRTGRQRLDDLSYRLDLSIAHLLRLEKALLNGTTVRLRALSPLAILERGYAVVSKSDGKIIRSKTQVQVGDMLNVQVSDGDFNVRAEKDSQS